MKREVRKLCKAEYIEGSGGGIQKQRRLLVFKGIVSVCLFTEKKTLIWAVKVHMFVGVSSKLWTEHYG